jgi:hypothetical protein
MIAVLSNTAKRQKSGKIGTDNPIVKRSECTMEFSHFHEKMMPGK